MGAITSCFANLLILSEKLSLWITCTVLICCLITTITLVLGLGIGLGYNYCFNDMMTRHKYVPAHYIYPGNPRWPYKGKKPDPNAKAITSKPITKIPNDNATTVEAEYERRENTEDLADYGNLTPASDEDDIDIGTEKGILSDIDLMSLLTKLKASHKNYTLQVVTP